MERIVIEIGPDGELKGDVVGGQGKDCLAKLNALLGAIGEKTQERKKPEYHQVAKTKQQIRRTR